MFAAIVVCVATGSPEEADRIAAALVENRLAACVQAHPISSTYRWEGRIEKSEEVMLTIKTRADLFGAVESLVVSLHSYEVPEIVALPVAAGHGAYLEWVAKETGR